MKQAHQYKVNLFSYLNDTMLRLCHKKILTKIVQ